MTERKMTPELQKKLAGLLPVSKEVGIPFYPPGFEDEDTKPFQPVFTLRSLTEDENKKMRMESNKKDGMTIDFILESAEKCIIKVENFRCASTGKLIDFVWGDYLFCKQMDIFNYIKKISGLSREEKEGLESPPQQTQE